MRTNRHSLAAAVRSLTLALALVAGPARLAEAVPVPYLDLPGGTILPAPQAESLRIVINVPGRSLHLVEGERLVARYPVAVGRPSTPTPRGSFRILQMAKDPTWAPKGGPVVRPGPRNPLGTRWMRITADGYGIHATNDPASILRHRLARPALTLLSPCGNLERGEEGRAARCRPSMHRPGRRPRLPTAISWARPRRCSASSASSARSLPRKAPS